MTENITFAKNWEIIHFWKVKKDFEFRKTKNFRSNHNQKWVIQIFFPKFYIPKDFENTSSSQVWILHLILPKNSSKTTKICPPDFWAKALDRPGWTKPNSESWTQTHWIQTKMYQKFWSESQQPVFDPFKFLFDLFKNPRSCKMGEKILPVIGCQDRVNILVPFNHFCVISGFHLKIIISKKFKEISIFKSFKNSKQSDRSCCQKLKFSKGLYLITSFMHKIFACI